MKKTIQRMQQLLDNKELSSKNKQKVNKVIIDVKLQNEKKSK